MNSRSKRAAFTLIELLVSAALTAALATVIVIIMRGATATWARAAGKSGAAAQARVVLDQLTTDLQSAVHRPDGNVWLAADVLDRTDCSGLWVSAARQKPPGNAGGSLNLQAGPMAEARFGQAGMWLRFVTNARGSNEASSPERAVATASAPVAVAYQIVRHGGGGEGDGGYVLHRSEVRPAEIDGRPGTLDSGCDLDPSRGESAYAWASATNDGTREGDPISVRSPRHASTRWANHVVDFGVRFYVRDEAGTLVLLFPTEGGAVNFMARVSEDETASAGFPEVVDAMVRVLTEEGARLIALFEADRLGARPAGFRTDAEWWWGIAEAHSDVYLRRIVLPAQR